MSERVWGRLPEGLTPGEFARFRREIAEPVAVTGATGFVGWHLTGALIAAGLRPRVLVRDPARVDASWVDRVEIVPGDLEDREALARLVRGSTSVFHLAGLVRASSPAAFDRANRVGTATLVEAWRVHAPNARLIHVSSLAAAGPSASREGRGPEEDPAPISAYGRSKLAGEAAVRAGRGEWVILRPPAIFGPRDIDVFQFFKLASRGLVPLPAGDRFITIAYVSDVVRAVLAAVLGPSGSVFHLGEPEPFELSELVRVLAESGGVRCRRIALPPILVRAAGRVGDALHRVGFRSVAMTSDKATELLARHWTARTADSLEALGVPGFVPFAQAAAATWEWYRAQGWLPPARRGRLRPATPAC
ncbi:MAG: NAD-dependent epimerase/dehydratase family protein [Acidobacteriota bacterium]